MCTAAISEGYKNSFVCDKFYDSFNRLPFRILSQCAKDMKTFSERGVLENIVSRLTVVPFLVAAVASGVLLSAAFVVGIVVRPLATLVVTIITLDIALLGTLVEHLRDLGIFILAVATFVIGMVALAILTGGQGGACAGEIFKPYFEYGGILTATLLVAPFAVPLLALFTLLTPFNGYELIKDIGASAGKKLRL
jgi:hypothetical protein